MAKTLRELNQEFTRSTRKTQLAYDKLFPPFGSDDELLDKVYKKAVRENNTKEIARLKPLWTAATKAYNEAQTEKNALRAEIKKFKESESKQEDKKVTLEGYDKAVAKLAEAELGISGYKGKDKYEAAYADVVEAYNSAVALGKTPSKPIPRNKVTGAAAPITTPDGSPSLEEVANNKYKDYTINTDGSVSGPGATRTYFVSTKNADGSSTLQEYKSVATARDAFLANYSAPGALDKLKQQLRSKNYISASQLASGDWIRGLDDMLGDYTRDAVTAVKYGGAKESPLIDAWFTKATTGSGTTSKAGTFKDSDLDLTTVGDAHKEINDYMVDALGRQATQKEKDAYYKDINARELKSAVSTVSVRDATGKITKTTRTGDFVTADEKLNSKNAIIIKALEGTDAGELLKSAKGSQVAVQIAGLQKAGAMYGQPLTAGEALKYVIEGGTEKDALAKQTERLRLNAMTMYSNLKDHIRDGGSVKDIADQYALIKSKKLGIPLTDAFSDNDVKKALTKEGGLMSTAEFSRQMQANPLWRQTEEARNTASSFADTILKSFGFMG
jgi:hypothetical protein